MHLAIRLHVHVGRKETKKCREETHSLEHSFTVGQ